ncbi:AAA family ATPase [Glaciibacter psychrotolerans]|uniref:MinD-like ATPase involved in chromosome partitioning or flagellar assembly n=1 Tax=Glaciibacter psychrotolerans TaxID=670054 RepID=A0A7Z0EEJ3_9MICO|nr:P-loop NTPase [Leifsonia psychrotolerans]NYJ20202.1 MinD-like ATPase involved in chromosome partitioning or flagellar assembly [Leifsonia psychrotolerans]
MTILALAIDHTIEDRILVDLVEHGHTVTTRQSTARELIVAIGKRAPEVVLVQADRVTLSAELLTVCDESGVRVVALCSSDSGRRYAASLGLYEVLDATAAWAEIEALLGADVTVPLRIGVRQGHAAQSRVVAVWGPAGAPGRTTLAINIAAEIAACGHTVALVDADTYGGSVASALGLLDEAPGFAAACRLAGADALTPAELERIAQRYTSPQGAYWVLTGLGGPSRWPELSDERITRTIQTLRQWVEYVVIDAGFSLESDEEISSDLFAPRRNAATLATITAADHVVACGLADPVGMARFLRAWVELGTILSTTNVSVVMNRMRRSAVGIDPKGQISGTLRRFGGITDVVLVPQDVATVDNAVLTGRTLRDAAPKSAVRASIRRLVLTEILPAPAPVPRREQRREASAGRVTRRRRAREAG